MLFTSPALCSTITVTVPNHGLRPRHSLGLCVGLLLILHLVLLRVRPSNIFMSRINLLNVWLLQAQDRDRLRALVSAVIILRVPEDAGSFMTRWGSVSVWGRTLFHGVSYVWILQIFCGTVWMKVPDHRYILYLYEKIQREKFVDTPPLSEWD
jgi:hypothetical protein